MTDAADVADVGCVPDLGELFVGIAVVILVVFVVVFVVPVAVGLLEVLAILLLGALVWVGRVLFRRPWSIVHSSVVHPTTTGTTVPDIEVDRWSVVGWREAHRVMVEAASSIETTGRAVVTPPTAGWA